MRGRWIAAATQRDGGGATGSIPRVAPRLVVGDDHRAERHGAGDGQQKLVEADRKERCGHHHAVGRHLHLAGADPSALLQIERQDPDPADAGAVTRQGQNTHADDRAAEDGREDRVDAADLQPVRHAPGEARQQQVGRQRLEGEGPAQGPLGQDIERQVQNEEDDPDRPVAQIRDDQGHPRDAAGHEARSLQQGQPDGDEAGADEERMDVLQRRMAMFGHESGKRLVQGKLVPASPFPSRLARMIVWPRHGAKKTGPAGVCLTAFA
ncbi:hypothetical protein CC_1050 [Caulobacter vibrioides CB15]|uniref:Uncharacterized protein n=1 Tax=Caulobacter vibrioides (strain ATCC 19089 / CIP 103742 / CB 15) TaxID=190650 RepID=Q9A9D8_CAUVC|nr:hypothetical protein CC_1050 [Caulobacter vibrioides CB15]